jgi:hypothetical protein
MGRAAREAIVITEPADAFLTKLAITLGLIAAREDSGNLVVRFEPGALRRILAELDFAEFAFSRYLLKYGHPPPRWWRAFDHPVLFAIARATFMAVGVGLLGRLGNKLSAAGVRAVPRRSDEREARIRPRRRTHTSGRR